MKVSETISYFDTVKSASSFKTFFDFNSGNRANSDKTLILAIKLTFKLKKYILLYLNSIICHNMNPNMHGGQLGPLSLIQNNIILLDRDVQLHSFISRAKKKKNHTNRNVSAMTISLPRINDTPESNPAA